MFTETKTLSLRDRVLRSPLVDLLTGPHGVDRYTELVEPTWTLGDARAKVVAVRRQTSRSVTLTLEPNAAFAAGPALRAGQHVNLTVEVDGRRQTRCYSPANAEGDRLLELTIGVHDGGRVSQHLFRNARPGMVVGLDGVGGDFTLPAVRPQRVLFVSGGSGITPVLSMVRTLISERRRDRSDREITFIHYARTPEEASYRAELDAMDGVTVLRGYSRSPESGDLVGYFDPEHLQPRLPPTRYSSAARPPSSRPCARTSPTPPSRASSRPCSPCLPRRPVAPWRSPRAVSTSPTTVARCSSRPKRRACAEHGCRMGICHSCTQVKTSGCTQNILHRRRVDSDPDDVQICVSVPVGDVELAL